MPESRRPLASLARRVARGRRQPRSARDEAVRIRDVYAERDARPRPLAWDAGALFVQHSLERSRLDALRRSGLITLQGLRILDVGCGRGRWLERLVDFGAERERLTGVDLLASRITEARATNPSIAFEVASATALPFPDATFDLVLQSTVLSSVLDEATRAAIAREMERVTRPGGRILWTDLGVPNPRNRDVRRVSRAEVGRLFPGWKADLHWATLPPLLARPIARRSWTVATLLERIAFPPFRMHLVGVLRAPEARERDEAPR